MQLLFNSIKLHLLALILSHITSMRNQNSTDRSHTLQKWFNFVPCSKRNSIWHRCTLLLDVVYYSTTLVICFRNASISVCLSNEINITRTQWPFLCLHLSSNNWLLSGVQFLSNFEAAHVPIIAKIFFDFLDLFIYFWITNNTITNYILIIYELSNFDQSLVRIEPMTVMLIV